MSIPKGNVASIARYNKANIRRKEVIINIKTEPEILEKLESVDNISGYIKSLIRKDIEEHADEV